MQWNHRAEWQSELITCLCALYETLCNWLTAQMYQQAANDTSLWEWKWDWCTNHAAESSMAFLQLTGWKPFKQKCAEISEPEVEQWDSKFISMRLKSSAMQLGKMSVKILQETWLNKCITTLALNSMRPAQGGHVAENSMASLLLIRAQSSFLLSLQLRYAWNATSVRGHSCNLRRAGSCNLPGCTMGVWLQSA